MVVQLAKTPSLVMAWYKRKQHTITERPMVAKVVTMVVATTVAVITAAALVVISP